MSPPDLPPGGDASAKDAAANNGASDTPIALLVEGILEGRVLEEDALRAAVARLSQCGAGVFKLEVTGGRFNVLPAETQVDATSFDAAAQSDFLDRLQAVLDGAQPGSIETTLRCKMVFAHEVAETLFVVKGHQVEPMTRRRPPTADDAVAVAPATNDAMFGLRRRELMWLAPALLLLGSFFAWKSGWIDRVLAARAEEVQTESGPFGNMLAIELERSWGSYHVTVSRGPSYPTTPEALAALQEASKTLPERAACELVGNGGELFVQLQNAEGKVLAETRTELRALLTDDEGKAKAKLPGNMSADRVTLSLSGGKKGK